MAYKNFVAIAENLSVTGSTPAIKNDGSTFSVTAAGKTTSGSGSAVIQIEATNIPSPQGDGDWTLLGTISLTLGTSSSSDGFGVIVPWDKVRARVTTLTGTGATLSIYRRDG